jgi:hypothetical protein
MESGEVDGAMSLGRPKNTEGATLGHFGVGLKAASFSQANVLTVLTRAHGSGSQGRRMHRHQSKGFTCEVLNPQQVDEELSEPLPGLSRLHGTVVRWDEPRGVPQGGRKHTDERLERCVWPHFATLASCSTSSSCPGS